MLLPQALVVGATSRNCGKTSFICQLVSRFQNSQPIAIKVKTLYPNDQRWHGSGSLLNTPFEIREAGTGRGVVDSERLLDAGAHRVFYLKTRVEFLGSALPELLNQIPSMHPLIFESNSVLQLLHPGIFLMIKGSDPENYKPSALRFMEDADFLIGTNGEQHFPSPSELAIHWTGTRWQKD